ncbi:MAG: DUF1624 domain-containing protein [Clostridia bacterium]|nr:DUF1624 domain-containing protein [Clostridia bacterium]
MVIKPKKNRIWEIDFFRGFAILMVVFDHAMVGCIEIGNWKYCGVESLQNAYNFAFNYITGDVRLLWRSAFLFLFFFISGVCTIFSKNNFKRALLLVIVGGLITLITYLLDRFVMSGTFILFGVIQCFAVIVLIFALIEGAINLIYKLVDKKKGENTLSDKLKKLIKVAVYFVIAVVLFIINEIYNTKLIDVFGNYMALHTDNPILGMFIYTDNWWKSDYFPLMPYISMFFLGAALGPLIYWKKESKFKFIDGVWHKPLSIAGQYSLLIYVVGTLLALGIEAMISYAILGKI